MLGCSRGETASDFGDARDDWANEDDWSAEGDEDDLESCGSGCCFGVSDVLGDAFRSFGSAGFG